MLCPKTLMYSAWALDIEKFQPGITVSLAYADNREEAFTFGSDVVVTNIDAVRWLVENENILKGFDDVVIDESTAFKTPTSQRTKAMMQLRRRFKHRHAMTGTPNPNTVMELWAPQLIIDDGARLGTSYWHLRGIMQQSTQIGPMANHLRWDDKPGAEQAVHEMIEDCTIRHAFEDVMDHVPPNHRHTKEFKLNRKAQQVYEQMENEAVVALRDATVSAVHAASLRQKLLQIASGAVYSTDEKYSLIDPSRYELIADLIESREHSVTFFNWKHQRDELAKELEKRRIKFAVIDGSIADRERDRIVADYQAGKLQNVLLHPRTGAHGLTLTRGDTTIVSSPFYEADLLKQAIHRIYRGGQTKVTNTIFVEAANTVERQVYERLLAKESRMVDLLSLIQNRRST